MMQMQKCRVRLMPVFLSSRQPPRGAPRPLREVPCLELDFPSRLPIKARCRVLHSHSLGPVARRTTAIQQQHLGVSRQLLRTVSPCRKSAFHNSLQVWYIRLAQ